MFNSSSIWIQTAHLCFTYLFLFCLSPSPLPCLQPEKGQEIFKKSSEKQHFSYSQYYGPSNQLPAKQWVHVMSCKCKCSRYAYNTKLWDFLFPGQKTVARLILEGKGGEGTKSALLNLYFYRICHFSYSSTPSHNPQHKGFVLHYHMCNPNLSHKNHPPPTNSINFL